MKRYLGIDAGSAFVGLALLDEAGSLLQSDYCRHKGDPVLCIKGLLAGYQLGSIANAVRTGSAGIFLGGCGDYIDPIVALVEGTKHFLPSVRNVLYIGAGSFSLTRLDNSGKYRSSSMNSACASGSGAFLEQQAYRLNMTPELLADKAAAFSGHPPTVATRCAVFAKTDMIHLQQNGFSPEAIATGLCRSLGRSTVDALLNGQKVDGETTVIGGVALNTAVIQAIGSKLGVSISRHPHPTLAGAIGAALVARAREGGSSEFGVRSSDSVARAREGGSSEFGVRSSGSVARAREEGSSEFGVRSSGSVARAQEGGSSEFGVRSSGSVARAREEGELRTPNSQLPTPNSKLQTPNSQLPTPNSQLQTARAREGGELQTPNSELPTPNSQLVAPATAGTFSLSLEGLRKDEDAPSPTGKLPIDRKALKLPLELRLSDYPVFSFSDYYVDSYETEVALVARPAGSGPVESTLGIDIGSTSTKATLVDLNRTVIAWAYRKTAGDPIGATKKIFRALLDLEKKHNLKLHIVAAGTTGSGRKMMHKVLRADLEMNEITAHARAAVFMDPEVDTIVELGGQDAKFTQLQNGVVYNSVMNYVCAAGTGSFIEEQAKKLGVPIEEYADFCLGVSAPNTSDRCTVFMERDLDMLLAAGWERRQVAAAVLHSVCDNYLNKVVNQLRIGNRVYFQGATARNKALVAAFEQRLGKRITVSPFCHMTGALGISLLLIDQLESRATLSEVRSSEFGVTRFSELRTPNSELSQTRFRGLEFADQAVKCETEKCDLCANHCSVSLISTDDETVAWGLMCGREYVDKRPKTRTIRAAALIEKRYRLLMGEDGPAQQPARACSAEATHRGQRGPVTVQAVYSPLSKGVRGLSSSRRSGRQDVNTPLSPLDRGESHRTPPDDGGTERLRGPLVGIPKTLTMWTYLPMWRAFFRELDVEILPSSPARDTVFKRGQQYVTAEFCAPVIVSHGHVADLLEKEIDYLFIPHMVREQTSPGFSNNHFCCYVQAHPSVIASLNTLEADGKLLRPVLDFRYGIGHVATMLHAELGTRLKCGKRAIRKALDVALNEQQVFNEEVAKLGVAALRDIETNGKMGIVLIGRPYNTLDPCMNLQLPGKIAERGYDIFFQDMLPAQPVDVSGEYPNMYWNSGQQILTASRFVAEHNNLFAVFFTSFSCGPDSYLLSYFKDEMARTRKPYLVLQFDGHGADAGYMTRVEAALESFKAWRAERGVRSSEFGVRSSELRAPCSELRTPNPELRTTERPTGAIFPSEDDLRRRLLFIPPMEPIAARFFAAAFRGAGFRAEVLEENAQTLATGLRHTGGGECVPCPTTLGSLIHTVEERGLQPTDVAFFMATAVGPCRFGQYNKLNEMVLRRRGWEDLRILAPSAANDYEGLNGALRKKLWDVFVTGDIVRKMLLRTRPYEVAPGAANNALAKALSVLEKEFENKKSDIEGALARAVGIFKEVKTTGPQKPKVAIVGEIYVRCNPFTNDNVIHAIEMLGGEALLASLCEWILYVHFLNVQNSKLTGFKLGQRLALFLTGHFYHKRERALFRIAQDIIGDRDDPPLETIIAEGCKHVPKQFQGEAILTLGRAACFIKRENVKAVVNASPMFCMPGTTTTSIFPKLERELGVPIICNFYDGSGDPNRSLIPYMHYIRGGAD